MSQAIDKSFYFTTSDGVQLYVRMAGEGKPCLFIHGGPGSMDTGHCPYQEQTALFHRHVKTFLAKVK